MWPPNRDQFETILAAVCGILSAQIQATAPSSARAFQDAVAEVLLSELQAQEFSAQFDSSDQQFPDIALAPFGVEVKYTTSDTWRSVANSISEGQRSAGVSDIYVVYAKAGGLPEVRWRLYEDCVIHVRTSHRPRFEIDMTADGSLFRQWNISYAQFASLSMDERMAFVRDYARKRLKPGEKLWWLDAQAVDEASDEGHSLELGVRLFKNLEPEEKRRLRAEAAILNPQIVGSGRSRNKYDGVAVYLITYHGVLANQLRDLYSAGSVAHAKSKARGGIYIQRSLQDIEAELIAAARYLDDSLILEYWGEIVPVSERLGEWLRRADSYATGWVPSEVLFVKR